MCVYAYLKAYAPVPVFVVTSYEYKGKLALRHFQTKMSYSKPSRTAIARSVICLNPEARTWQFTKLAHVVSTLRFEVHFVLPTSYD